MCVSEKSNVLWFFPHWFGASICKVVMAATVEAAAVRLGSIKTGCEGGHCEVTSNCGNDLCNAAEIQAPNWRTYRALTLVQRDDGIGSERTAQRIDSEVGRGE